MFLPLLLFARITGIAAQIHCVEGDRILRVRHCRIVGTGGTGRSLIVAGLILGWFGDVALSFRRHRAFMFGLVAFLSGHVAYGCRLSAAVKSICDRGRKHHVTGTRSVGIALVMEPVDPIASVARRDLPVLIAAMVGAAVGQLQQPQGHYFVGAILFALSDLLVARERFVAPGFANALIGLPIYYTGQSMIAVWLVYEAWGFEPPNRLIKRL